MNDLVFLEPNRLDAEPFTPKQGDPSEAEFIALNQRLWAEGISQTDIETIISTIKRLRKKEAPNGTNRF